jgi:hypothetical protein
VVDVTVNISKFSMIRTSFHILMLYIDCKTGIFSLCAVTNDLKIMETLYGHRICGAFGYSHLTGKIQTIRIY